MRTRRIRRKEDRKPRSWQGDIAIEDVLIALAEDPNHYSAAQICRQLEERFPSRNVPDVRTVRRHVDEVRGDITADDAAEWHAEEEGDFVDARAILDVWGAMLSRRIRSSDNQPIGALTNLEADWIIYATQLAPGLKPYATGLLSRLLMVRHLSGRDFQALDILLAMAPWTSKDAHLDYADAVESGRLPKIQFAEGLLFEIGTNLASEAQEAAKTPAPTAEKPMETVSVPPRMVEKLVVQSPAASPGPATIGGQQPRLAPLAFPLEPEQKPSEPGGQPETGDRPVSGGLGSEETGEDDSRGGV